MIIVSNIISIILLTYTANSFLTFKYSKKINILILILQIIAISIMNQNTSPVIILLFLYFFYIYFQFNGKFTQKMIIIIPFFLLQITLEILFGFFFNFTTTLKISKITLTLLFNIIVSLFSFGYSYMLRNVKEFIFPKYTWITFILPIIVIILTLDFNHCFLLLNKNPIVLFVIATFSILSFTTLIIFLLFISYKNKQTELNISKQHEQIINTKYNLLDQHYYYNFKFLHNLLHTCYQLNTHVNESNYPEATKILNNLTDITFKEFNSIYSNSLALNSVIKSKLEQLTNNEINIKTAFECTDFNSLNFITQINLFEYLLNLTINNCLNVPASKRLIIIKSKKITNNILIQISFPKTKINNLIIKDDLKSILNNIDYFVGINEINATYICIQINFTNIELQ